MSWIGFCHLRGRSTASHEPILHGDHLDSTGETTGAPSSNTYRAYGRESGDAITEFRFTGQETNALGLVYMHARYYDPHTGQFLSPDTIVPSPNNLFDYNRYMYVRGNPLKYSDPSGHYCVPGINLGTTCTAGGETWNKIQLTLDGVGLVDPTPISDGVNALVSAARGNWTDAGLSAIAMVPYIGDLAKGAKYSDEAWALGKSSAKFVGDSLGFGDEAAVVYRKFTHGNFRLNLMRRTIAAGGTIPTGVDAHHILPQNSEAFFNARGINIHDPQFGVWVESSKHRREWRLYQDAWEVWIAGNASATAEEILKKAKELTEQFNYVN